MFDISKIYDNVISCYSFSDVCDAEEVVSARWEMTKFEPIFETGDKVTARKVALIRYQASMFKKYYYNLAFKHGFVGSSDAFVIKFEEAITRRMAQIQAFDDLHTSERIEFWVDVDLTLMAMYIAKEVEESNVEESNVEESNIEENNVEVEVDNVEVEENNVEESNVVHVVGISGATVGKIKDASVVYCDFIASDADKISADIVRVKFTCVDKDVAMKVWDITSAESFTLAAKVISKKWEERSFSILEGDECVIDMYRTLFNKVKKIREFSEYRDILLDAVEEFGMYASHQYNGSAILFYKTYAITFLCAVLLDNGFCEEDLDLFILRVKGDYLILK
jgi:hypothetical protein